MRRRALPSAVLLIAALVCSGAIASAASATTYTPSPPSVDGIINGPYNTSQGDPSVGATVPTVDLFPTYTPPATEPPNVAVYPAASATTPYPSGVAGTPGPLAGLCTQGYPNDEFATQVNEPANTDLPFAPYYFPDIVRNPDGSLTGYFDWRPKDADEAIVAAKSTNNGLTWIALGKALEQNQGYCPTADTSDDGQGHPYVTNIGGTNFLYTLQRQAGDNPGVGLLVNQINTSASNPLATLPATQSVGIDPNTFATGATNVPVGATNVTGVSIPVSTLGTAGTPEQIVNGTYEDIPAGSSALSSSTIINCTGPTSDPTVWGPGSLTGCTSATSAPVTVNRVTI